MFAPARDARTVLDRTVSALPDGYHAIDYGNDRVVIGPTGAFALAAAEADLEEAAERASRVAVRVRHVLASRLSWAPFVEAMVVVDTAATRTGAVALVPGRLLARVVTAGPWRLDEEEVDRMVLALAGAETVPA